MGPTQRQMPEAGAAKSHRGGWALSSSLSRVPESVRKVRADGYGGAQSSPHGRPEDIEVDKETEARGERAWPRAPKVRGMVQTRSSPARVLTLCSHCQREAGNVENLAPVLPPNTSEPSC